MGRPESSKLVVELTTVSTLTSAVASPLVASPAAVLAVTLASPDCASEIVSLVIITGASEKSSAGGVAVGVGWGVSVIAGASPDSSTAGTFSVEVSGESAKVVVNGKQIRDRAVIAANILDSHLVLRMANPFRRVRRRRICGGSS